MPSKKPVSAAVQAIIEERRTKVAAGLLQGLSYRELAGLLKVSLGTIASDAKAVLKNWRAEQQKTIEEKVTLDLKRLDVLLNSVWGKALGTPEIPQDMGAFDRALKIIDQRSSLLLGIERLKKAGDLPEGAIPIKGYIAVSPDDWPAKQPTNGKANGKAGK